jgi:hypothetical protein
MKRQVLADFLADKLIGELPNEHVVLIEILPLLKNVS